MYSIFILHLQENYSTYRWNKKTMKERIKWIKCQCISTTITELFYELFIWWNVTISGGWTSCIHNINEPSILREISTCTSLDFGKPSDQQKEFGPLLGQGIISSNWALWARQSKILAPEFYMEGAGLPPVQEKTGTFLL